MRPYSLKAIINETRKVFNYRLSRARRIVENTFGIVVARWRVFQRPIEIKPEKVEKITLAAIALHNYLRQTNNAYYTPSGFIYSENSDGEIIPGQLRNLLDANTLQNVKPIRNSRYKNTANEMREPLANHLATIGSVSWQ